MSSNFDRPRLEGGRCFFFKFRYLVDAPEDEQHRITEGKRTYRVLELYDEVLTTFDRYWCLNISK